MSFKALTGQPSAVLTGPTKDGQHTLKLLVMRVDARKEIGPICIKQEDILVIDANVIGKRSGMTCLSRSVKSSKKHQHLRKIKRESKARQGDPQCQSAELHTGVSEETRNR